MSDLPKHEADYESWYDEGNEEEFVEIACPHCAKYHPVAWYELESESEHECKCGYRWQIA
jgi:hypothetical protein